MRRLASIYTRRINPQRFRRGVGPDGKKWPQISASTAKSYLRKFGGATPGSTLTRTKSLQLSVRSQFSKHSISIFSADPRAATHQFGDPKRNIPARKFIGLSQKEQRLFAKIQAKWLVK